MKAVVLPLLFGLATAITGAFMRACEQASRTDLVAQLSSAFCLPGAAHPTAMLAHQHCTGCALLVAGAAMIIVTPLAHRFSVRRAAARARS